MGQEIFEKRDQNVLLFFFFFFRAMHVPEKRESPTTSSRSYLRAVSVNGYFYKHIEYINPC